MLSQLLRSGGLLLAAVSTHALAAQGAAPPPTTTTPANKVSASRAELLALAEAMAPRDAMVSNELAVFNKHFATELRKQEGFADLEKQYPTLVPELEREMGPPFQRYMNRMLDQYMAEVATVLGTELDASGVAVLAKFYQSPAGQRTVRAMLQNFDSTELADTYSKGGQPDAAMLERGIKGAAAKATKSLSAEDQTALLVLMKEPAFWSLQRVNKQVLEIKTRIMNAEDPQFDKDTEAVFERVMARVMSGETAGSKQ